MTRQQFILQVESTQKAFRRFLCALCCGDSALADDIAQESYVKAWLSCDGLESAEKFKAWLHRIGYTTFVNHRRAVRVSTGYEEARGISAPDTADTAFRYQDLYQALNKIPDKERSTILLYYMEDYSIKEIAAITGFSQDAIKQHLSRGRNHLKGLLDKD